MEDGKSLGDIGQPVQSAPKDGSAGMAVAFAPD
jgi:hypothetical protein